MENELIYKISDVKKLDSNKILELYENGNIVFTEKYKEKARK